ncbi:MAG TPA: SDR family oxidoreductase [Ignavibacteriaceae bacterium]|nr:SDR family oxidoreductase [Ignavibacteriaceae bacterium]
MTGKILIICSTGKVGVELIRLLNNDGIQIRAAARNPLTAAAKFPSGVETVEFDFDKPETFAPALKGIEKVFLMARPGDNHSDEVAAPLIDEAKKQGIRHIVNLTAFGAEKDDNFMLRKLEKYLEASEIAFTHLRPNWFMQIFNSGPMFIDIKTTGALHLPAADAKLSFIDIRDIAAAGAAVLKDPNHIGRAYTLTGGESLDHFQAMEIISRAANKKVSYIPITDETSREALSKAGIPVDVIERWSAFYKKVREGFCAPVFDDLQTMIGRSPITFSKYATDYASSWN